MCTVGNRPLGIRWWKKAPEIKKRFAVEAAHTMGFISEDYEFPCVKDKKNEVEYVLDLRSTGPVSKEKLKWICDEYDVHHKGQAEIPVSYKAAPNIGSEADKHVVGGLENLFECGWILQDNNGDGLPDDINCRILIPEFSDDSVYKSACDLALRLGMETTEINCPVLLSQDDGKSNIFVFTGKGTAGIHLKSSEPRKVIEISGSGDELETLVSVFVSNFPDLRPHESLKKAFEELQRDFCEIPKEEKKAESLEYLKLSVPVLGERDEMNPILERGLYSKINPGDHVDIRGSLWQSREVREETEQKIRNKVLDRGGIPGTVHIFSSYKEGLSWIEEEFAPQAFAEADVASILIEYYTGTSSCLAEGDERTENPPRWLQDLYPVDCILQEKFGIEESAVTFAPLTDDAEHTYRASAFDKQGNCVLRKSYYAHSESVPYLRGYPDAGMGQPPADFLDIYVNGQLIGKKLFNTDAKRIWDTVQETIFPYVKALVIEKLNSGKSDMPLFSNLKMDVMIGGEDRIVQEKAAMMISPGEALDENLYYLGQAYLRELGKELTGRPFRGAGLVLPVIHYSSNGPCLEVSLTEVPEKKYRREDVVFSCTDIEENEGSLCITAEVNRLTSKILSCHDDRQNSIRKTVEEMFCGYDRVTITYEEKVICSFNPNKPAKACKDLDISQIDIPEGEVIGYEKYRKIMSALSRVPGLSVFRAGKSIQGREIYAVEPEWGSRGYTSMRKRISRYPSLLINGRHHANEVSATNGIIKFCKLMVEDPAFNSLSDKMNIVLVPMENVDGAAMHYQLSKEHPLWQFHSCYTNSAGEDLMPQYYMEDTPFTEAKVFPSLMKEYLPDAIIDCHGVPHHEMPRIFNPIMEYKGLWIPRAPLCTFYFHITGDEFASNTEFAKGWDRRISQAFQDKEIPELEDRTFEQRFCKYSLPGYMEGKKNKDWDGNLLRYWIPAKYNPNHPYPTIRMPWQVGVMFTAEAADETAHGEDLEQCADLHLKHIKAGVQYLLDCLCPEDTGIEQGRGQFRVWNSRVRPLVPEKIREVNESEKV